MQPAATVLLKEIPQSTAIRFILGPIFELVTSYKAIFKQRSLMTRNIIHTFIIIITFITGAIFLPVFSKDFANFLAKTVPVINITGQPDTLFTNYFGGWIISYPSAWISRTVTNIYSLCRYGDTQYFLYPNRLNKLAKACGEKPESISDLFLHIRGRLRSGKKTTAGARPEDLIEFLTTCMDGEIRDTVIDYKKQKTLFTMEMWSMGETDDIFEPVCIKAMAEKYKRTEDEMRDILEHCVRSLQSSKATGLGSKQDYADIISGFIALKDNSLRRFNGTQKLIYEQKLDRQRELEKIYTAINTLRLLQVKRKHSPALPKATLADRKGSLEQPEPAAEGTVTPEESAEEEIVANNLYREVTDMLGLEAEDTSRTTVPTEAIPNMISTLAARATDTNAELLNLPQEHATVRDNALEMNLPAMVAPPAAGSITGGSAGGSKEATPLLWGRRLAADPPEHDVEGQLMGFNRSAAGPRGSGLS